MANLAPIAVTTTAQDITTGLSDGQSYFVQNVSGSHVEYAVATADPTGSNVGWNILLPYQSLSVAVTAGEGLWCRVTGLDGGARLIISDAA